MRRWALPDATWLDVALEWIGMLVAVALFGATFWLYLMATADQAGAEADFERAQPCAAEAGT